MEIIIAHPWHDDLMARGIARPSMELTEYLVLRDCLLEGTNRLDNSLFELPGVKVNPMRGERRACISQRNHLS